MNYHEDDGSTLGGIVVVGLCLFFLCVGYTVRDRGITFKVQASQVQAPQVQGDIK